jgi:hypothetical protein
MMIELQIDSTPENLKGLLYKVGRQIQREHSRDGFTMFSEPIDALFGIVGIQLWGIARDGFEYGGHIRVYPFGNNDSLLHFETTDVDWPYLRPWWEQIHAELPQSKLFRKAEPAQAKRDEDAPKPWEVIPDVGWNRRAVELWHTGYKAGEIAAMIGNLTAKTVYNRLSDLRRIYGTEVVPERRAKSTPGRKLG